MINPKIKSVLLISFISITLLAIGYWIGSITGLITALFIAFLLNFVSYFYADKIVLAMYPVEECEDPEILRMVKKLSMKAKMPMPKVYIANVNYPNAFATGRNPENGVVVITRPLIELLNDKELEAVIAHELGHIKHRDILVSTIASAIATAITFFLEMALWFLHDEEGPGIWEILGVYLISLIILPIIQLAISRQREYMADEFSAKITHNPHALINALKKIENFFNNNYVYISPSTSALMIFNPKELLSTHPSLESRIKHLLKIEKQLKSKVNY